MNEKTAQNLAEQIAALLKQNAGDGDDLRLMIGKLTNRLENLESKLTAGNPQPEVIAQSIHPSLQRFKSLGEIADVILDRINNQKECPYEPAGKPCDNCSMCSSRGF